MSRPKVRKILPPKRNRVEFSYDGFTVVLTGMGAICTSCEEIKPASEFGFRRMKPGDHIFRNQPQCKECRSKKKRLIER